MEIENGITISIDYITDCCINSFIKENDKEAINDFLRFVKDDENNNCLSELFDVEILAEKLYCNYKRYNKMVDDLPII
jgi:hypothetical protein